MSFSILLVDDEPNILKTVGIALEASGYRVTSYQNPLQALDALRAESFDIGLFDLKMEPMDGIQLLREAQTIAPEMTVVLMTAHGSINTAVQAIKLGAYDYLQKPFELSELQHFMEKVQDHHRLKTEVRELKQALSRRGGFGSMVTRNERMKSIMELAMQMAGSNISVLVEGESGTGKELLAHLIHDHSPRHEKPFVTVNCTALAETLVESELFGHVRGAFTGAVRDREGRFAAADGGTVFLDEIGEIPPPTQVKLLRFLQHKEFERVGETTTSKVDVRVIAATNRDLQAAVDSGAFREDLYYRLNAVRIKLPPLRERQEDIPLLSQHFLKKLGGMQDIAPAVMHALQAYAWKGNVRELENVMERALILARGETIQLYHLPEELQGLAGPAQRLGSLEEVEQQQIIKVLRTAKDLDEAAAILGIDPATLWRKRKKYNL